MKRRWKNLLAVAAVVGTVLLPTATAYAQEGYTYNYDFWGDVQYSPDAYSVTGVYTAGELGIDTDFNAPAGMFVEGNEVYICDTGNNRIVQLERKGKDVFDVKRIIENIQGDVETKELLGPTDICATDDGYLYICDKGNHRILKLDDELNYVMEFVKPTDATFDQSQEFLPDKLVVDAAGRVFCIADNINKGMIKYESDGTFTGFLGASEVTYNWTDYLWKKFATQAQRAKMESFVPTEYDNIYMDYDGFIYACTTNVGEKGLLSGADQPVRRLNMMGKNILIENGNFNVIGDVDWDNAGGYKGPSLITDVTALDNGVYFALDKVRGRMFGYDNQGNMLYAFGGNGNLDGCFKLPVAVEHIGTDLLVLDAKDSSFTVFTPTAYGEKIYQAIAEYDKGDYDASGETWKEVMKENGNYDLAYIGIGRALMRQGKYGEAMKYFKLKWDDDSYSKAFKQFRKHWVEDHIVIIFVVIFLLFIVPMLIGRIKKIKIEIDTADIFKE